MTLPDPEWWTAASRSDLVLLGKALRTGRVSPEKAKAIFQALRSAAAGKGERFRRRLELLLSEYGELEPR
jgi:hypothetical protein